MIEPHSVIYQVNLSIDVDVIERFDQWLHRHTEEMLAIRGFISASISIPDVEDVSQKHRCVQYRLSDQKALDNYLENHSDAMRAESNRHFGGHFSATRRVLSIAEAAFAKHRVCANCEAELLGRFCNVCGQREEPRVPTLGSVTGELTHEVFGVGSKLWRSISLLLFKPGQLTAAYISGKRQKYMSPIRLYLLFSIVAFALLAFLNSHGGWNIDVKTAPGTEITQEIDLTDDVDAVAAEANSPIDKLSIPSGLFSDEVKNQLEQKIKGAIRSIQRDVTAGNTEAVISKFVEPLPTVLFLFLPIVALLFKILYLPSRKHYVEHLIYIVHNHTFVFAAISASCIISEIVRVWPRLEIFIGLSFLLALSIYAYRHLRKFLIEKYSKSKVKGSLSLVLMVVVMTLIFDSTLNDGVSLLLEMLWLVYLPFYLFRSIRVVYQHSRWVTALSLLVISVMYFVLLVVMLLSSAVFVGLSYS